MARGPAEGLQAIEALETSGRLDDHHLLHAARADILRRMGSRSEAANSYRRALQLDEERPRAALPHPPPRGDHVGRLKIRRRRVGASAQLTHSPGPISRPNQQAQSAGPISRPSQGGRSPGPGPVPPAELEQGDTGGGGHVEAAHPP